MINKKDFGMDRKIIASAAWLSLMLAPAALIVGHLGVHALSWRENHVSTFAARAPNDGWITAAMLLAAFAMVCIAIGVARDERLGGTVQGSLIAMSMGAAISGLLLLAAYEERAAGLPALRKLGFGAIRQQSFHDAGLLIFFYGAVLALLAAGVAILVERKWRALILGAAVAASGPLAYAAMTTAWPAMIGIAGASAGLKQRAAFLLLWVGTVLLLAAVTRRPLALSDK